LRPPRKQDPVPALALPSPDAGEEPPWAEGAPRVLTLAELIRIHEWMIGLYGGTPGVRDQALLEAVAMMPAQSVNGHDLHPTVNAKAAAYLYHLCRAYPFADGYKRTALAATELFLNRHDLTLNLTAQQAERLTRDVAGGMVTKEALLTVLPGYIEPRRSAAESGPEPPPPIPPDSPAARRRRGAAPG
jgi:Prophage maintenance system killer protein